MEIHLSQLIFQILNFAVLVFILNKFLYKPITTIIDQRNKKIEDSIRAAEDNLKEKATIDILKKKAIESAEKEAVKVLEKAKSQASIAGKEIVSQAQSQAEEEMDKKLELLKARMADQEQEVISKISELVVKTTAKVLADSLSASQQKKIVDTEIKKLSKLK